MLPALRVSTACLVRVREDQVLDRELDVDHAAGVVLEIEKRGAVRMAREHPPPHVDDIASASAPDRAADGGWIAPGFEGGTDSRHRRRRSVRG